MSSMSRRPLLGTTAAAATLPLLPPGLAQAAAPFRNTLPAGWHRFKIGEYEATIVSDGALPLGDPVPAFPASPKAEIEALLTSNFLVPNAATLEQNALILNTGRQLILFDTGMGESMGAASRMFGPTTGKLLENMRAAGIQPEQIDMVVLTHAHCDHCWALVDANGNRNFPNAQVAVTEADLKFWTDDGNKRGPEFMTAFIDGAKKNLSAYKDRMVMVRDEQPVVPGVVGIFTPGHTVGHSCYAITSGNTTVMNTGDLAHHHILLMRQPLWEFSYDTDPKQSAQSRSRMLDRLARDRIAVLSYHFPWPGLGHVAREGSGYGWYPTPMNLSTL
ncbi:MBL fold metallo-hydrolase [Siccirubricoccus deserti]|uniref:MBL fold metallo-hydrolase n=1 Tax=Siccirubricoccus deserti TaxID=2013562 RepID=A0A9X0QYM8_9PROT|nr:MBL fold metallo-hydrolase [Siccirubricoccus deserti]MBC4015668.1 MBL fold metallo-hydrolase [Siccirubricoccus deserti]GGC43569.1 MBL fold metallo-hydrolase [Siccirubricoccus deserti]